MERNKSADGERGHLNHNMRRCGDQQKKREQRVQPSKMEKVIEGRGVMAEHPGIKCVKSMGSALKVSATALDVR